MDKKGISKIVIVVIIVVVVLVVGVAAYWALSGGGGGNGTGDGGGESGGGGASNGATDGGGNGGGGNGGTTVDVTGANSLRFSVSVTHAGEGTDVSTYRVKNAGTSSMMMRIDVATATGEDYVYIINGAQQKVWIYGEGEWTDLSIAYNTYWDTWNSAWEGYRDSLEDWTGLGEWSYTSNGETVRIYNIDVNPSLADSLFEP